MWTPPYKECSRFEFLGKLVECGSSNATIMMNLGGKKIGEIAANKTPKEKIGGKSKVFGFKFHHGSKIEFLLAAKIINGYDHSKDKPHGYGAGIKFGSFKIDECFSKCE